MKLCSLINVAVLVFVLNFGQCLTEDLKLLILHNNDMHGRFEETSKLSSTCKVQDRNKNCYGGFGRVAHVIREARKAAREGRGPEVLYLNAGDTYTGTPWFSVHKWKIVSEMLNLLRPDAASFGNHEFDGKVAGVIPFLESVKFPIVAANLDFSKEPALQATNVTKSVVLDVAGRKIGVIGYLTPETAHISAPENVIFKDEVASIKAESERLDALGVKIIIAVGHSGFETDKKIGREVPLVDLVVGGHTNTFLWNGPKPDAEEPEDSYPTVVKQSGGKQVPVVQAYAYTKYMGHLSIVFNDKGEATEFFGQPILLNSTVPQDQDVLDVLEKYRSAVEALDQEEIGRTRVILDGSVQSCRFKECNFGNLITDAFVAYHASLYGGSYWTDAPIAVINGGAIRNTIEPKKIDGTITRGEMLGSMPFDDQIYTMTLNGSDLLKTLEIGIRSNGETSRGELLQTSGLHVRYDVSKPVGSRVVEAKARCSLCSIPTYQPIDPRKDYRIVTTGFLNTGGDGHFVIRDNGRNKALEDLNDLGIVAWYVKQHSPIYPEEQERMIVEGRETLGSKGSAGTTFVSVFLMVIGATVQVLR